MVIYKGPSHCQLATFESGKCHVLLWINDYPKGGYKPSDIALQIFMRLTDDFEEMICPLGFFYQQQVVSYKLCRGRLKG